MSARSFSPPVPSANASAGGGGSLAGFPLRRLVLSCCCLSMTADPGHTYRTAGSDYSCTYRVYIPVHTSNYHKKLGNPFV